MRSIFEKKSKEIESCTIFEARLWEPKTHTTQKHPNRLILPAKIERRWPSRLIARGFAAFRGLTFRPTNAAALLSA